MRMLESSQGTNLASKVLRRVQYYGYAERRDPSFLYDTIRAALDTVGATSKNSTVVQQSTAVTSPSLSTTLIVYQMCNERQTVGIKGGGGKCSNGEIDRIILSISDSPLLHLVSHAVFCTPHYIIIMNYNHS